MRGLATSFTGISVAALFILGTDAAAVTFDDGLVHVIDAGNWSALRNWYQPLS